MNRTIKTLFYIFLFFTTFQGISQEKVLFKTGKINMTNIAATTTAKGQIQLSGDIGGSATTPTVVKNAIISSKLADLSVTNAKIAETINIKNGGTGDTNFTSNSYIVGNGSINFSSVSLIPDSALTGVLKKLNGNTPDANGAITIAFNTVRTGLLTGINSATPTVGDFYVVSGDLPTTRNGNLYSFNADNTWSSININSGSYDSRYLSLTGGTLNGKLTIPTTKRITIVDDPTQANSAVNKNYVDSQFGNLKPATTSSAGTMTSDDENKLINFPNTFNTALLNSKLAFWDGLKDPSVSGNSYPSGAVVNSSSSAANTGWDSTSNSFRLTDQVKDSNGNINYNFTHLPFMYISFQMKAYNNYWGASYKAYSYVGNGIFLYCFADKIPLTEFGSTTRLDTRTAGNLISTGYTVCFSEYARRIDIRWGGGPTSSDDTTAIVGGYQNTDSNPGTTNATSSPANAPSTPGNKDGIDIGDNKWHTVKIFILGRRILVYWDNVLKLNTVDKVLNRDLSNTNFGFVGRTGGSDAQHFIRGFTVEHYKEGAGGITIPEF